LEPLKRSAGAATTQYFPFMAIFRVQASIKNAIAQRQAAQRSEQHKGVSDGRKWFGSVANGAVFAAVGRRSEAIT
jgi:hypothetical protein